MKLQQTKYLSLLGCGVFLFTSLMGCGGSVFPSETSTPPAVSPSAAPSEAPISFERTVRPAAELLKDLDARNIAVNIFSPYIRDPHIIIGPDNKYYMTATQYENAANGQGFPMWRSTDLVNWERLGIPYQLKDSSIYDMFLQKYEERKQKEPTFTDKLKLWAPELYYYERDQRWIVVHTSNVNFSSIALGEKNAPLFKTPITDWGTNFGHQHDPSLFIDPADGSPWLICRAVDLIKIKPDFSGFAEVDAAGNPKVYAIKAKDGQVERKIGHEGCHMIKIGSKYVLFGTAWSTDKMREGTYNLYYATADSVTGTYGPRKFVGRGLGHGRVFQDLQGRWWCTAFQNGDVKMTPAELAAIKDIKDFPKDANDPNKLEAITANANGFTLVPLEVKEENGNIVIKTLDPNYANPGPEEVQKF